MVTKKEYQRKIGQRFFDKHLRGQPLTGEMREQLGLEGEFNEIDFPTAVEHAQTMAQVIFGRKPRISYEQFERRMLHGITKLDDAYGWLVDHLNKNHIHTYGQSNSLALTHKYFIMTTGLGMRFRDQLASFKAHWRASAKLLKTPPSTTNEYRLVPEISNHPETHISLSLYDPEHNSLGEVGGIIHLQDGKPLLRVTNVQGLNLKKHRRRVSATFRGKDPFKTANKALGQNWRVLTAAALRRLVAEHGIRIVGDMPVRFANVAGKLDEKGYQRVVRQYKQTYRKAGIKISKRKQLEGDALV